MIAGGSDIAGEAEQWLRIAVFGAPLILVAMAGNGWMRGVQNTVRPLRFVMVGLALSAILCPVLVHGLLGAPRLELVGSAVANVVGQAVSAGCCSSWRAGAVERVDRCGRSSAGDARADGPRPGPDPAQPRPSRRASSRPPRSRRGSGPPSVAAHQVVLQLWNLVALTLDSLAIAAQTLVGAALGAGRAARRRAARAPARHRWSHGRSRWRSPRHVRARARAVIPELFTADAGRARTRSAVAWWFFVAIMPVAGVVFALDGVLLGAGDAAVPA